jgi:hypothetical protein
MAGIDMITIVIPPALPTTEIAADILIMSCVFLSALSVGMICKGVQDLRERNPAGIILIAGGLPALVGFICAIGLLTNTFQFVVG